MLGVGGDGVARRLPALFTAADHDDGVAAPRQLGRGRPSDSPVGPGHHAHALAHDDILTFDNRRARALPTMSPCAPSSPSPSSPWQLPSPSPIAPRPRSRPIRRCEILVAGNQAFVAAGGSCARQSPARRAEVSTAQHPVAVVVGCADSRVPPEAIFGQGIGNLFVIRVAGNVVDDTVLGSIEYAVDHLGATLVVVLGHERCGAVEAAVSAAPAPAHVDAVVRRIRAALAGKKAPLDEAVRINVAASVRDIAGSTPVLAPAVQKGRVKVVGARYDLDSGAVELLDATPR